MENPSLILMITAATIGIVHTLLGPDHYIPFIVMAKAGKWSKVKTIWITVASGLGHVTSSVVIGIIGISAGYALNKVELIESFRADFAAWLIISFGLIYSIWGIKRAYQHKHAHHHMEGEAQNLTPWIIFTIFVLGPCEPLIPLLIYPSVLESVFTLASVVIIFSLTTSVTMVLLVTAGLYGMNFIPSHYLERYSHAIAGVLLLFCGVAIKFLGL
jgi:nickel/cobalt transporter (NicO) family protein